MTAPKVAASGIRVVEARVADFRSLKNVLVPLHELTLLVGANNSGKTNFLDALNAALGSSRKPLGPEDIYLDADDKVLPKTRKAIVDLLLRPADDSGNVLPAFPKGSYWTNLWGPGISQDDSGNDFVGIRSTLGWNAIRAEYDLARTFLKEWLPATDWTKAEEKHRVTGVHLEPITLHYIDAQRDLEQDLRSRGSFWRRLTDDLGLTPKQVEEIEKALTELNETIVKGSEVLVHVRDNLSDLRDVVSAEKSGINISPLARRLRDLSRGVDVTIATLGGQQFPLVRHGMGTRSLASLLVFKAYVAWKVMQAHKGGDLLHGLLALEEPEAHLHPQAQRALYTQLTTVQAQRIVSTHSPYIAGQAALADLRLFLRRGSQTEVRALDLTKVSNEERGKVERKVVATKGDLLFSRGLILFEGETEELAFPIWAKEYWGHSVHELGFSFVAVDGQNYWPFVWLAHSLGIPWFIFSDGDGAAIKAVRAALAKIGITDYKKANVTIIPNNQDIEAYIVAEGYLPSVDAALSKAIEPGCLDAYVKDFDGKPGPKKVTRDYSSAGGRERAAVDAMRQYKTEVAAAVATEIVQLADKTRRIPTAVATFLALISKQYELKKASP